MNAQKTGHELPFGRHKDTPLADVPTDYLQWALASCKLSSGLRSAVASELSHRGVQAPAAPPPPPIPACRVCGPTATAIVHWMEDKAGRKRLRAACQTCRRFLTFPPCREPYLAMADALKSEAPVLDALIQLDALGVAVQSDGQRAQIRWEDRQRVPPELQAIVHQCSHQLAVLIGDDRRATIPTPKGDADRD